MWSNLSATWKGKNSKKEELEAKFLNYFFDFSNEESKDFEFDICTYIETESFAVTLKEINIAESYLYMDSRDTDTVLREICFTDLTMMLSMWRLTSTSVTYHRDYTLIQWEFFETFSQKKFQLFLKIFKQFTWI